MQAKMLSNYAVRCEQGCCRVFGKPNHRSIGRKTERRNIKRSERNAWRRDV